MWKFLWQSVQLIKQGLFSVELLHRAHVLHSAQYHRLPLSTKLDKLINPLLALAATLGKAHDECRKVFLHSQQAANGSARFCEFFKSDPKHFEQIAFVRCGVLFSG